MFHVYDSRTLYRIYIQKNLTDWMPFRDLFLDELLRHDGRRDCVESDACYACGQEVGTIKCCDCFCRRLRCRQCVVDGHKELPLHRIEVSQIQFPLRHIYSHSSSNGMANSLTRLLSSHSAFGFN